MEIQMKSTNIKTRLAMIAVLLFVVTQACRLFTPGDQNIYVATAPGVAATAGIQAPTQTPGVTATAEVQAPTQAGSDGQKTDFPLPENVSNFTDMGNEAINFQTNLSITDAISFYRE